MGMTYDVLMNVIPSVIEILSIFAPVLCVILQGVQQNCSHLVICSFVGFYSCKWQKLGRFRKIQEICYKIGTQILKIDLEIAEIIEVKVGNPYLEIYILLLHR